MATPRTTTPCTTTPWATVRAAAGRPYLAAAAALAGLGAVVAFDPLHRHVPLCPFHAATGWLCPLCGGLRAVDALAHGRAAAAVHDNVLVAAAVPLAALLWLDWLIRVRSGRPPRRWPRAATVPLIALAVAFTVLRNLPFATALRP